MKGWLCAAAVWLTTISSPALSTPENAAEVASRPEAFTEIRMLSPGIDRWRGLQ